MQYRRSHIPDAAEKINFGDRSHKQNGIPLNEQSRAPFAVLAQNTHNVNLPDQHHVCNLKFSDYGNAFRLNFFFLWNLILAVVKLKIREQDNIKGVFGLQKCFLLLLLTTIMSHHFHLVLYVAHILFKYLKTENK